jgi:hypothetical protein
VHAGALLFLCLVPWPQGVSTDTVFADVRAAVGKLGVYRALVTKSERVRGKVIGPQTAEVWVRESPRALRMTFLDDNGKPGRRLVYNEQVRAGEMLVREAGLLGHVSVWVDINGWLSRRQSNHGVRDVGFGPLLDLVDRDRAAARAAGGHARLDEPPGAGPDGTSCLIFIAPPGARPLYAARTRLCFQPDSHLPVLIEVQDRGGFLERYLWRQVQPRQSVPANHFTPEGLR